MTIMEAAALMRKKQFFMFIIMRQSRYRVKSIIEIRHLMRG